MVMLVCATSGYHFWSSPLNSHPSRLRVRADGQHRKSWVRKKTLSQFLTLPAHSHLKVISTPLRWPLSRLELRSIIYTTDPEFPLYRFSRTRSRSRQKRTTVRLYSLSSRVVAPRFLHSVKMYISSEKWSRVVGCRTPNSGLPPGQWSKCYRRREWTLCFSIVFSYLTGSQLYFMPFFSNKLFFGFLLTNVKLILSFAASNFERLKLDPPSEFECVLITP